jgi:hypothetical protein
MNCLNNHKEKFDHFLPSSSGFCTHNDPVYLLTVLFHALDLVVLNRMRSGFS